ncbi:MAG TPA: nucleotidyltransferase family protein [Actinomycetes bacterium]|jgi:nicotine blue oxidoreductase|nr:nucleotidyltransferase family protein [Actinomycetes bacterium]
MTSSGVASALPAAGVLLAAGAGRRFGRPKALVELDGQTLAARGVQLLRAGGCDPVLVVEGAAPLRPELPADVWIVPNPDWSTGMGSSLRVGLRALAATASAEIAAAVVVLVDQPWVVPEAVTRVRAGFDPDRIVQADYPPPAGRSHPVLIPRSLWESVATAAHGDAGARGFIAAHPELVTAVPCPGSPADVDTPEQLPDP